MKKAFFVLIVILQFSCTHSPKTKAVENKKLNSIEVTPRHLPSPEALKLCNKASAMLFSANKDSFKIALHLLDEAIQKDPKYILAYCNKAKILYDLGDKYKALNTLLAVERIDSCYATVISAIGFDYEKQGLKKKATSYYQRTLQLYEQQFKNHTISGFDFNNYLIVRFMIDEKELSEKDILKLLPNNVTAKDRILVEYFIQHTYKGFDKKAFLDSYGKPIFNN